MQSDFILIENVSHEYSNELEYSIKLLMKYIEQLVQSIHLDRKRDELEKSS